MVTLFKINEVPEIEFSVKSDAKKSLLNIVLHILICVS